MYNFIMLYTRGSPPGVLEPQRVRKKLQGVCKKVQGCSKYSEGLVYDVTQLIK